MKPIRRIHAVPLIAVVFCIAGYRLVGAGEPKIAPRNQPTAAQQAATTAPKARTIALPSPLKWPDKSDLRPPDQIPQDEQEKLGLEFLRAYHPLRTQEIERNKPQNPAEYYQTLRQAFHERLEMEHQRAQDPQGFAGREEVLRYDARAEQLAMEHRNATPDKQPVLELQLRELLSQVFELRQAQMEQQLKEMEREYLRLKNVVEKRRKNKDRVVELRALQLLGLEEVFQMW